MLEFVALLVLVHGALAPQTDDATILRGVVVDPKSKPVAGAIVEVRRREATGLLMCDSPAPVHNPRA